MKTVYKVVRNVDGTLWSAIIIDQFCLQYNVGEWIKPILPNSRILCFSNLMEAKQFAQDYGRNNTLVVYKALCYAHKPIISVAPYDANKWDKCAFWVREEWKHDTRYNSIGRSWAPDCTVGCRQIKLIEQV